MCFYVIRPNNLFLVCHYRFSFYYLDCVSKKCPNNKKKIYNDKYRHTRDRLFGLLCHLHEQTRGDHFVSLFACFIIFSSVRFKKACTLIVPLCTENHLSKNYSVYQLSKKKSYNVFISVYSIKIRSQLKHAKQNMLCPKIAILTPPPVWLSSFRK